jgi:hypothetical protein
MNNGDVPFKMNAPKACQILCVSESQLQIIVDSPPFFVGISIFVPSGP